MAAQNGQAVTLGYGNQGARQNGAAVVLDYQAGTITGAINRSVKSGVRGTWHKADSKITALFAPQPASNPQDHSRRAVWLLPDPLATSTRAPWTPPVHQDTSQATPWGKYDQRRNDDKNSLWKKAQAADDLATGLWDKYGPLLTVQPTSRYKGSQPADDLNTALWIRQIVQVLSPVPFPRPGIGAANFKVIGGGIVAQFGASSYTPPLGNAITLQFGTDPYAAPWYLSKTFDYVRPSGKHANFLYAPVYEPALDCFGNLLTTKGLVDPYRLAPWGLAKHADNDAPHPWQVYSRPLNPGWGVVTPGGPVDPPPGETITIPVQRVYIVLNEVQLIRIAGLTPITALTVNVAFDVDSWLPQFSATIPESARDAIMPDPNPVEIGVFINGTQFNFLVEKIQRNRQFGQRSISIGGRGIACELDSPYAVASHHTHSTDQTAQQIIDAALTNTTYTQTWNITDWLIPGNTFSHFGTPASVAAQVAEASGSVLQADRELRNLRMLPRYPVKPWDWATATPEYIIPADIAQTESIEWIEKPTYNVVYVSGTQNGVLGQVKITGTAGDKPAPMVTHPLITHNDAARQRGISILGDTGRKAMMQITMPVLESSGIIDVCRLIEFSDGTNTRRGLVRANSVSVNWPTVRQTLTVEAAV